MITVFWKMTFGEHGTCDFGDHNYTWTDQKEQDQTTGQKEKEFLGNYLERTQSEEHDRGRKIPAEQEKDYMTGKDLVGKIKNG